MSERPTRIKTWGRKGCTPTLHYSFNWKQLSLIAGATFWRIYFRFFNGAIKAPQLVEFLRVLRAQIKGKLLIIWDGLPVHRSRMVRDYVESLDGASPWSACLATRRNLIRSSICSAIPSSASWPICAWTPSTKSAATPPRRLKSMQRRPALIRAFWKQAELPI